jgi:IMP dehydrogenase
MRPEDIEDLVSDSIDITGYEAENEDETTPLLVNPNDRKDIVDIKKEINKAVTQKFAYTAFSDSDEELRDNDSSVYQPTTLTTFNVTDVTIDKDEDEDLLSRLNKLRSDTELNVLHKNVEIPPPYSVPIPSAPQAETLTDMQVVDLNKVIDEGENKKKFDNIASRYAHLTAQYYDILNTQHAYEFQKWYDGIPTDLLTNQTYDDVNLLPTALINFNKHDINMETQFTRNIKLKLPIVSSPMDTITEDRMAIQMALLGGIGIIHCNNTPESQARMVNKVKRYTNGLVMEPAVFDVNDTIQYVIDTKEKVGYNFSSFPVTYRSETHGILLGLLTKRDISLAKHIAKTEGKTLNDVYVKDVMRSRTDGLVTLTKDTEDFDIDEIKKIMIEMRITKLPIVNKINNLLALACRTDIINMQSYPNASLHQKTKQLLVGAAISTGSDYQKRVDLLANAGVDVIVIDSSQGCSEFQINTLLYIKEFYPHIDVVCGNVATSFQTTLLTLAGADAIRVGMGAGSICTTQNVTGTGRGQLAAILATRKAIDKLGTQSTTTSHIYHGCAGYTTTTANSNPLYCEKIPIIADGGIKSSGDITKAYAVGANTVMLGSLIAGTDETPGLVEERPGGFKVKKYRGMGSIGAMQKRHSDRYMTQERIVAQGVSGEVLSKGSVCEHLGQIIDGVKSGLQNIGINEISKISQLNEEKRIRWEQKTHSTLMEGNVHSLYHFQY